MAKRSRTAGEPGPKDQKLEPVAIYLVKFTTKAQGLTPFAIAEDQKRVTQAVKAAGGSCELFNTAGGTYDFVSIVRGISDVHVVVNLASIIQATGVVTATLMPGFHIFK